MLTLTAIINFGNLIINNCIILANYLSMTPLELTNKFIENSPALNIPLRAALNILENVSYFNTPIISILLLSSLGFFVVYTLIKWVVDIVL